VKRASENLTSIFEVMNKKAEEGTQPGEEAQSPFAEITEDDIDNLFR
jgi:hypothetical protein